MYTAFAIVLRSRYRSQTVAESLAWITATNCTYSVSQKSSPPKTFCKIFTPLDYISMKFCRYVASLYRHIFTNFGGFILIFNKIALIFLGVPIVFNVLSFKFHQVKLP